MVEKSYCKKCKKTKNIEDFYKSSLSRCKDCRKKDVQRNNYRKNEVLCMMDNIYNKINYIELLYRDILDKNNRIIDILLSKYKEDNIKSGPEDIKKTLDNIKLHDKNIKDKIDYISNYKRNNIILDNEYNEYNEKLKEFLVSDSEDD